jgi:hypothetical protein
MDNRRSIPSRCRNFLFTTDLNSELCSIKFPIEWITVTLSPGIKRPRCEADLAPPSNVEVKNVWSYISAPTYAFMAWWLIKHRDSCNFIKYHEEYENVQSHPRHVASCMYENMTLQCLL